MASRKKTAIQNICQNASKIGASLDLADCYYGQPHWEGNCVTEPSAYYFFLAGLVRTLSLTHILELGTHCGGSAKAICTGINTHQQADSLVVTVDSIEQPIENLSRYPMLRTLIGDCLDPLIIGKITQMLPEEIDLLFIDSDHSGDHVEGAIRIYGTLLNPRYIVLDDIFLNDSMAQFWRKFSALGFAENISEAAGREETEGMGFISWRGAPLEAHILSQ